MRAVIQRVSSAKVIANGLLTGEIAKGFVILLGIEHEDNKDDVIWLVDKIRQMRVFADAEQKMNLSINDISGETLLISQFTLHASTKKGNRPSFIKAALPEHAIPLYEYFKSYWAIQEGKEIQSGIFGADMQVSLVNDGPVRIILDSRNRE